MAIVLFHSYTFQHLCHVTFIQVNIFSCPEKHLLLESNVFRLLFHTECSPPNQKTTQRRWSGFLDIQKCCKFMSINIEHLRFSCSFIFNIFQWCGALPQCDKLACRYGAPHVRSAPEATPNRKSDPLGIALSLRPNALPLEVAQREPYLTEMTSN